MNLGGLEFKKLEVYLESFLTKERVKKIHHVVEKRISSFIPVFENIYDEGNMSASMRSAEAFGFYRFYVLNKNGRKKANRVSRGSDKWLDISYFSDIELCIRSLQNEGFQIVATDLCASESIEEVDFQKPTALIFGNEHKGVSQKLLEYADKKAIIPMHGFCPSFNISVAASLSFYHVYLQKRRNFCGLKEEEKRDLRIRYYLKCIKNHKKLLKKRFLKAFL